MVQHLRDLEIGECVWQSLRSAGGFVFTHEDGSTTVHFNRGRKPTADLIADIKRRARELKLFVAHRHDLEEKCERRFRRGVSGVRFNLDTSPCVGSPRPTDQLAEHARVFDLY